LNTLSVNRDKKEYTVIPEGMLNKGY